MYSGRDTPKGWVSPFGHPRINDRSHLPAAFRSVPRPSSPLGAKASTECPSLTPYPHHRPRTGPKHALRCFQSRSAAPASSPGRGQVCPRTMCVTRTHNNSSSSPCERTCSPSTPPGSLSRIPGNATWAGFGSVAASHRGHSSPGLRPSTPHHTWHRRISSSARGAGGNGDGRIRTDDPLLAKQVLSH